MNDWKKWQTMERECIYYICNYAWMTCVAQYCKPPRYWVGVSKRTLDQGPVGPVGTHYSYGEGLTIHMVRMRKQARPLFTHPPQSPRGRHQRSRLSASGKANSSLNTINSDHMNFMHRDMIWSILRSRNYIYNICIFWCNEIDHEWMIDRFLHWHFGSNIGWACRTLDKGRHRLTIHMVRPGRDSIEVTRSRAAIAAIDKPLPPSWERSLYTIFWD